MFRKILIICLTVVAVQATAKTWTLNDCINYAYENSLDLRKLGVTRQTNRETWKESKAQLFPSLTFTTNQNVSYTPWTQKYSNGMVDVDKVYYNGAYTVGASWTLWNGNRNRNTIKQNIISEQMSVLDSIELARDMEEQIITIYYQILYSKEAIRVNKETLEAAKVNENRGLEMVEVGSMSKAECSQLTATRAQDEYNVTYAENNVKDLLRQMKTILEIEEDDSFDIASDKADDSEALQLIPSVREVYEIAKENRPEMKKAKMELQKAELQQKIARALRYPTIGLSAQATTNTSSAADKEWNKQMQTNFTTGAGVSVSVPIFDQRLSRTARNKAALGKLSAEIDIQDTEVSLFNTIDAFSVKAKNNQNQFKAAKVSTKAAQDSYELLSEQFSVGLKNIVELQEGKTRLLSAQYNELQAKYTTILYIELLKLYEKQ